MTATTTTTTETTTDSSTEEKFSEMEKSIWTQMARKLTSPDAIKHARVECLQQSEASRLLAEAAWSQGQKQAWKGHMNRSDAWLSTHDRIAGVRFWQRATNARELTQSWALEEKLTSTGAAARLEQAAVDMSHAVGESRAYARQAAATASAAATKEELRAATAAAATKEELRAATAAAATTKEELRVFQAQLEAIKAQLDAAAAVARRSALDAAAATKEELLAATAASKDELRATAAAAATKEEVRAIQAQLEAIKAQLDAAEKPTKKSDKHQTSQAA